MLMVQREGLCKPTGQTPRTPIPTMPCPTRRVNSHGSESQRARASCNGYTLQHSAPASPHVVHDVMLVPFLNCFQLQCVGSGSHHLIFSWPQQGPSWTFMNSNVMLKGSLKGSLKGKQFPTPASWSPIHCSLYNSPDDQQACCGMLLEGFSSPHTHQPMGLLKTQCQLVAKP